MNGPDLSFQSQDDDLRHLDTFGHGTHLAGIIAGRDDRVRDDHSNDPDLFVGVAPDARILNVKVASGDGATDVSQVIAAIDWVVQHRDDNGMNIRVLNLSFGTDGDQSYALDPLVAPGRSLVSLRDPGSTVDRQYASAVVIDRDGAARFFRGSGTSQASAFVSGVAALVVQRYPSITPDQVKKLLVSTAVRLPGVPRELQGAGRLDVDRAINAAVPSVAASVQPYALSVGTGSLEAARGTAHVVGPVTGAPLTGEQDIFGVPWDGSSWSGSSWSGSSWSGGTWSGSSWSGSSWSGSSWSGSGWSGSPGGWSGLSLWS